MVSRHLYGLAPNKTRNASNLSRIDRPLFLCSVYFMLPLGICSFLTRSYSTIFPSVQNPSHHGICRFPRRCPGVSPKNTFDRRCSRRGAYGMVASPVWPSDCFQCLGLHHFLWHLSVLLYHLSESQCLGYFLGRLATDLLRLLPWNLLRPSHGCGLSPHHPGRRPVPTVAGRLYDLAGH